MTTYATETTVSSERSRNEIEKVLQRFGASHFGYMTEPGKASIAFVANRRPVRIDLPIPSPNEERFWKTPTGRRRAESEAGRVWDQEVRSRWRALAMHVKSLLASVEVGVVTFEEAFLAHLVLPGGKTVSQQFVPQLAAAAEEGRLPRLMLTTGERG